MKARRRLVAVVRRETRRLTALAAERAAATERVSPRKPFRPLTSTEAAAIVGVELPASLTDAIRS